MAEDPYAALGVKTFINASLHSTRQGGSLMPPEVVEAMSRAAQHYVDLPQLHRAAGKRVAELVGAPAALVTSGAAGGILVGIAGCLTGTDRAMVAALPGTPEGGRNEIVVWRSRPLSYMQQAAMAAGGKLVPVGDPDAPIDPEAFRAAVGPRTAAVLLVVTTRNQHHPAGWEPPLAAVITHGNAAGVPVLVDAAAELPPRNTIRRLLGLGAAGVIVSGGKALRGPQASGLLCGRPDLTEAATLNACPSPAVGRSLKVGKEEICGLVAAVERFYAMDEREQLVQWRDWAQLMVDAVSGYDGVRGAVVSDHPCYEPAPFRAKAVLSFQGGSAVAAAVAAQLEAGEPSIQAPHRGGDLILNPMPLEPGQPEIIAHRLRAILGHADGPLRKGPNIPAARQAVTV